MPTALQPPSNLKDIDVAGLREWYKSRFEELVDELFRPGVPVVSEGELRLLLLEPGHYRRVVQLMASRHDLDIDDIRAWRYPEAVCELVEGGRRALTLGRPGLVFFDEEVQSQLHRLAEFMTSGREFQVVTRPRLYLDQRAFTVRVVTWADALIGPPVESK